VASGKGLCVAVGLWVGLRVMAFSGHISALFNGVEVTYISQADERNETYRFGSHEKENGLP
jgi:hypothetical protein